MRARARAVTVDEQAIPDDRAQGGRSVRRAEPRGQARRARGQETPTIYATLTPETYWSEPFIAPIAGPRTAATSATGASSTASRGRRTRGPICARRPGHPIYAANRGRVVLAKNLFYSGNAVFIDHGLGLYTTYLHFSEIKVEPGTDRRARPADRAGGCHRPRDRAAPALGRANRRCARRSVLAAQARERMRRRASMRPGPERALPCGSGKKYKYCCALKGQQDAARHRIVDRRSSRWRCSSARSSRSGRSSSLDPLSPRNDAR